MEGAQPHQVLAPAPQVYIGGRYILNAVAVIQLPEKFRWKRHGLAPSFSAMVFFEAYRPKFQALGMNRS